MPPTPPISESVSTVENGERDPIVVHPASERTAMITAAATTATNFSAIRVLTVDRNRSYRPTNTTTNATHACRTPHAARGTEGKIAAGTSALAETSALETK